MARTCRIKSEGEGIAHYHLISRTNNKAFLFDHDSVKDMLVDSLKRAASFSGVKLEAYTIMSNHFHVVVEVDRTQGTVSEEAILQRVAVLKGEKAAKELAELLKDLHAAGFEGSVDQELERWRVRMNDVSAFMKTFKELVNRRYKEKFAYVGSIWSGRFTSTMIEDGVYLARCLKYVVYNPVRAGMVTRYDAYRWTWCEVLQVNLGTVPDGWELKRVAQIGAGKLFGSEGFIHAMLGKVGTKYTAKTIGSHPAGKVGFSTHGWRIACECAVA